MNVLYFNFKTTFHKLILFSLIHAFLLNMNGYTVCIISMQLNNNAYKLMFLIHNIIFSLHILKFNNSINNYTIQCTYILKLVNCVLFYYFAFFIFAKKNFSQLIIFNLSCVFIKNYLFGSNLTTNDMTFMIK